LIPATAEGFFSYIFSESMLREDFSYLLNSVFSKELETLFPKDGSSTEGKDYFIKIPPSFLPPPVL